MREPRRNGEILGRRATNARAVEMRRIARRPVIVFAVGAMAALTLAIRPAFADDAAQKTRPNIVLILADDLGWADLGCYGSRYHQTPHLDAFANRGMRFTQAYAASPLCSPTRASVLTGLYPARIGITNPVCHEKEEILAARLVESAPPSIRVLQAVSATRLKLDYFTLAEALQEAGYATGHFGKWHLGLPPYDPLHQGFGVDFPHWSGPGPAGSYVAPWKFPPEMLQGKPGEHLEERMASEVVKFLRENRDRPFFLNYWCFSVHSPWNAKPELVDKYRATADPKQPRRNPVYAAMVESLDDAVGRVVHEIDDLGIADRTVIVFMSDNGGVDWHEPKMKANAGMDDPPTSNLPLRGGKASLYEGGTREPLIVAWPGVARAGAVSDALVQSTDFYPTILEICGLAPRAGQKFDGVSFAPALRGGKSVRDSVFCSFPHLNINPADEGKPGAYVREGDWKLIRRFHGNLDQTDAFELFNLANDLGETNNLAIAMPDKTRELDARLTEFLADTRAVIPRRNPAYVRFDRWAAGRDAKLTTTDDGVSVACDHDRPTIHLLQTPRATGELIVSFRMRARRVAMGSCSGAPIASRALPRRAGCNLRQHSTALGMITK